MGPGHIEDGAAFRRSALRHGVPWAVALLISASTARGQVPAGPPESEQGATSATSDLADLDIEDLMSMPVTVGTKTSLALRETPGVVSVVTRDEIERTGARDLLDILHQVPGFAFGVDVAGVVGPTVRGNWGHEGKVLLLIDGIEINDTQYLNANFGHHLPASLIERVEIVRGPGSAVYGGYAELAVISVQTRGPEGLLQYADDLTLSGNYAEVSGVYGQRLKNFARRDLALLAGHKSERLGGLEVSLAALIGQATRADRAYTDSAGAVVDLTHKSDMDTAHVNLGFKLSDLRLRLLFHQYRMDAADGYIDIIDPPPRQDFKTWGSDLQYEWKLYEGLSLTPRVAFKQQVPWQVLTPSERKDGGLFASKTSRRLVGGLSAVWAPLAGLHVLGGAEGTWDQSRLTDPADVDVGLNSSFGTDAQGDPITEIVYRNLALYVQGIYEVSLPRDANLNLTLGGRAENHSQYGASIVPRLAANGSWRDLHLKFQYAHAFKAPGIENINSNPDVTPERTRAIEGEVGYRVHRHLLLVANIFDIRIKGPIIYGFDAEANAEFYRNVGRSGSRGVEAEARAPLDFGFVNTSYSFYHAGGINTAGPYEVPGHQAALLGAAQHKLTALGSFEIFKGIYANPGLIYLSARYAMRGVDVAGNSLVARESPILLLNFGLLARDLGFDGLDVSLHGYNLLHQPYRFVQPYAGGHAPLPGLGTELALQIGYRFHAI